MNKRNLLFCILNSAFCICAMAQMDNVVEVENNYKPTVKDANKINVLPEIENTQVSHYNVDYTTTAIPTTNYSFQPIWAAQNNQLIKSDKKGFATFGYGSNNNTIGRIAYGFDLTPNDELNAEFSLRGHVGDVDWINSSEKWSNRFFTGRLKAGYVHHLNGLSSLQIGLGYGTDVFNYQPTSLPAVPTDKQHNDLIDVNVALTPYYFGNFAIAGTASYNSFHQQYATTNTDEFKEDLLNAKIIPSYKFNDNTSIDVELCVDHASYGIKGMKGHTDFDATPHFYWHNDFADIKAGVYINNDVDIAPDVDVVLHFAPEMDIYLEAQGGEINNTFRRFAQMTPYWYILNTQTKLEKQFDQLRARAGVRLKPIEGFYADLSAGYEISKNRAEIADFLMGNLGYNYLYTPIIFADGKHFYANADLKYNYQNIILVDLNTQFNIWKTELQGIVGTNTTNWDKLIWRPQFEANWKITAKPIKNVNVGVDFIYESFKKYDNRYERENTMNLGAFASYTFPFRLSIYAKGENLLNRKYDQYTMYRSPGVNFLVGAALTF